VNTLREYLQRAADIIGERTAEEERYDREVLRWLERGKPIKKALAKANEKYPKEALRVEDTELADVQAHYEYLLNHERMMGKLKR
jgi:phage shock protein A